MVARFRIAIKIFAASAGRRVPEIVSRGDQKRHSGAGSGRRFDQRTVKADESKLDRVARALLYFPPERGTKAHRREIVTGKRPERRCAGPRETPELIGETLVIDNRNAIRPAVTPTRAAHREPKEVP
jgi:hypothetical protein